MPIWTKWRNDVRALIRAYVIKGAPTIMQPLRWWRPFAWPSLIMLAVIVVLLLAVVWWRDENRNTVTCGKTRPEIKTDREVRGYVELSLKSQHPVEPTVESTLFLYLARPPEPPPSSVMVRRSGVGTYLGSMRTFILRRDGPAADAPLESPGWQDFGLVSRDGRHRDFPFDSRSFEFTLDFSPDLPLDLVRLTNRVPGFSVPCKTFSVGWASSHELQVRFDLKRDRLIQLFAVVFVVVAAVFPLIIVRLADVPALATSVASYFLSLWSLRRIMEGEIHVFPSVFDAMILGLSVLLLVLLMFRVAASQFQRTPIERGHSREDSPAASDSPPYM
jgi:hypothetical protein